MEHIEGTSQSNPSAHRRDPRLYQIASLGTLLIYGLFRLHFDLSFWQIAVTIGTALLTQYAGTRYAKLPCFDPKSALISSLSLCILLRTVTRFSKYEKTTEQVTRTASAIGPILAAIGTVKGYVIHMGETERIGDEEAFCGEGAVSGDGLVIGTYLHGLFTNPSARNALLSWMYAQKGLEYIPMDEVARHDPYEQLAAEFERHLQLDPILALFES